MARTAALAAEDLAAASITRALLNTATAGSAVIAKAIAGTGISFSSTGADAGTGDVTISSANNWAVLNAAYTLTSQTAAQKLFNSSTNGALTLPIGVFEFDCLFSLTGLSATSGSFGFAFGGTSVNTQAWLANASKSVTLATPSAPQISFNTAANTALATASVNTTGLAFVNGIVRVTTAGTLIPQVSLGVAAAAAVGINSFFRISVLGASGAIVIGSWS